MDWAGTGDNDKLQIYLIWSLKKKEMIEKVRICLTISLIIMIHKEYDDIGTPTIDTANCK